MKPKWTPVNRQYSIMEINQVRAHKPISLHGSHNGSLQYDYQCHHNGRIRRERSLSTYLGWCKAKEFPKNTIKKSVLTSRWNTVYGRWVHLNNAYLVGGGSFLEEQLRRRGREVIPWNSQTKFINTDYGAMNHIHQPLQPLTTETFTRFNDQGRFSLVFSHAVRKCHLSEPHGPRGNISPKNDVQLLCMHIIKCYTLNILLPGNLRKMRIFPMKVNIQAWNTTETRISCNVVHPNSMIFSFI